MSAQPIDTTVEPVVDDTDLTVTTYILATRRTQYPQLARAEAQALADLLRGQAVDA